MICPKCGTDNRNANAICFRCGAPLHAEIQEKDSAVKQETENEFDVLGTEMEPEEKPKKIGFFARLFGRWKREDEYDEYEEFGDDFPEPQVAEPVPEANVIPVSPLNATGALEEVKETDAVQQEGIPEEAEGAEEEEVPAELPVVATVSAPEETENAESETKDEETAEPEAEPEELQPALEDSEETEDLEDLPYVEDMQDWSQPDAEVRTTEDGFTTLIGMREDEDTMPKKVYRRRMSMSYMQDENPEEDVKPIDEELHDDLPAVPQNQDENETADEDVFASKKMEMEDIVHTAKYTKEELNPAQTPVQVEDDAVPEEQKPADAASEEGTEEGEEISAEDVHTGNTQKYVPIRRRRPEPSIFSMPLQTEVTPEPAKVADTSKRRMRSIINALDEDKSVHLESRENYEERLRSSARMAEEEKIQKRLQRLAHARRPVYGGEEKEQELSTTEVQAAPVDTQRRSEPTYVRTRTYIRDEQTGDEALDAAAVYASSRRSEDGEGYSRSSRTGRSSYDQTDMPEEQETVRRSSSSYAVNRAYQRDAARRARAVSSTEEMENRESRQAARSAVWNSNQVSRRTADRKTEKPSTPKADPVSVWNEMDTPKRSGSASRNVRRDAAVRNNTGVARLTRKKQRRRRKFKNPVKAILILAAAAILALAVLAGLFFGIRGIVRGIEKSMDAKKQAQIDAMKPTIEETTLNGKPAHKLTFTGSQGELIYITELKRTFPISDGKAVVTLDDGQWISNVSTVGSIVEVTLNPILYSSSGKQTVMPPVVFSVDVPVAPLTIIAPKDGRVEINSSLYEIQIQVVPGSKVSIGGQDVSDLQDGNGNISYNVQVEAVGDNPFAIEVSANGYTTNHASVIIHRPFMTIPTEFKNTEGEVVKDKSVTLTGKTEPGVKLSLDTHPDVEITLNDNGEFSFKTNFTKYGENTFTLRVKKDGVEDTVISTTVYYSPNLDTYSRSAQVLDYPNLADAVGKLRNFEVKGTITEIVKTDDPFTFLINVGTEDAPKIIRVEMVKKDTYPQQGNKCKVYADMKEMGSDGIPVMIGRFWFDA